MSEQDPIVEDPVAPVAPVIEPVVEEPVVEEDNDNSLLKEIADELQAEFKDVNLSHLNISDRIKTFRAMKKGTAPGKKSAKPIPKTEVQDPPAPPDTPKVVIVPLCDQNKRGSAFDQKLKEMKAVGGDILKKLRG